MDWIVSGGGPLICLEKRLENSWGGADALTVEAMNAKSDYDRACQPRDYVNIVPVKEGFALILGDMPLDSSIWTTNIGTLTIVRVFYSAPNKDVDELLSHLDQSIFSNPIESIAFSFQSSAISLFDSVEPGSEAEKPSLSFEVEPGNYVFSRNNLTLTTRPRSCCIDLILSDTRR